MEYITSRAFNLLSNYKSKSTNIEYLTLPTVTSLISDNIITSLEKYNFFSIYIVGIMGSGKTTLTRYISNEIQPLMLQKKWKINYINVELRDDEDNENYLSNMLAIAYKDGEHKNVDVHIVVIDDASYFFSSPTKSTQRSKRDYTLIRHIFEDKKVLVMIVGHLLTAVPPILRASNISLYTTPPISYAQELSKLIIAPLKQQFNFKLNMFQKIVTDGKYEREENNTKKIIVLKSDERPVLLVKTDAVNVCKFMKI
ncbi:MAG: ATP-binding protein [Candidatus Nitrosocaldaceae archaeon]